MLTRCKLVRWFCQKGLALYLRDDELLSIIVDIPCQQGCSVVPQDRLIINACISGVGASELELPCCIFVRYVFEHANLSWLVACKWPIRVQAHVRLESRKAMSA